MKRRKSDSPQKAALRELMTEYLKSNDQCFLSIIANEER